jgi:hypothetical protein
MAPTMDEGHQGVCGCTCTELGMCPLPLVGYCSPRSRLSQGGRGGASWRATVRGDEACCRDHQGYHLMPGCSPTNWRDDSVVHGSDTSATISGYQRSTISSILDHAKGLWATKKSTCWVKPKVVGTYK